jgi:hypothetical protein
MKRIVPPALLVLCVLSLLAKERSFGRGGPDINLSSLKWQLLQPNVSKTDMGGGLPEVAILTLSNEQFEKIHASEEAALEYLDSQHIFKRKLIKVIFCDVTSSADGDGWILLIPHTPHSTASIAAWQIPNKGKEK